MLRHGQVISLKTEARAGNGYDTGRPGPSRKPLAGAEKCDRARRLQPPSRYWLQLVADLPPHRPIRATRFRTPGNHGRFEAETGAGRLENYKNLQEAARIKAKTLSERLPAAHEDQAWLTNIQFRNDCNVRLTRTKFEDWMSEAFLEGFKHQRRLKGEASLALFEFSRSARLPSLIASALLSAGLGLIAEAFGIAPLPVATGTMLVSIAALLFAKRL